MLVPARQQAPRRHGGHTTTVTIGGERLRLTASQRTDGTLGEIYLAWGKHGSSSAGLLDGYAAALSLGLEHGVPLPDLLRPGLELRFAPHGGTDDPEIPRVRSVIDYLCRRLAIDWLPYADRASLGVLTPAERAVRASGRGATAQGSDRVPGPPRDLTPGRLTAGRARPGPVRVAAAAGTPVGQRGSRLPSETSGLPGWARLP